MTCFDVMKLLAGRDVVHCEVTSYKVLLQYYSVQHYSVLQSTIPALLQYYSVLQSSTHD